MKKENVSKGLGDTIEKITKKTGIKKAVKFLFGNDCGCDERQELLNKMFPYKVECLNEEEYKYLNDFNWDRTNLDNKSKQTLLQMYNRIFNKKQKMTNCVSCWRNMLAELNKVYTEYKK